MAKEELHACLHQTYKPRCACCFVDQIFVCFWRKSFFFTPVIDDRKRLLQIFFCACLSAVLTVCNERVSIISEKRRLFPEPLLLKKAALPLAIFSLTKQKKSFKPYLCALTKIVRCEQISHWMNAMNVGSVQMSKKSVTKQSNDSTATKNEKINVGQTFRKMLKKPQENANGKQFM